MNPIEKSVALTRHEGAAKIIADYEAQHDFKLPEPWHPTIEKLLLNGLTDPDLHRIFETLMQVEHEAGRLAVRPTNYSEML